MISKHGVPGVLSSRSMRRTCLAGAMVCLSIPTVLFGQQGYDVQRGRILTGPIVQSLTGVANTSACAAACTAKSGCRAFTYIPSAKICEIKGQETFQAGSVAGYISGVATAQLPVASAAGAGFYMIVVGDPQHPRTLAKYNVQSSRYLEGAIIKSLPGVAHLDDCAQACEDDYDNAADNTPKEKVCSAFTFIPSMNVCEFKSTKAFAAPVTNGYTSGIRGDTFNNPLSETHNRNFIASANRLAGQLGSQNVRGVIINGDLTEYGQDWELAKYRELYHSNLLPATVYPGLGNHDYNNNVTDEKQEGCPENSCANRMVLFFRDEVRKLKPAGFDFTEKIGEYQFPSIRNTYEGSLAYSWDINNVHFVQLNLYPGYQRDWAAYVSSVTPDGSAGARTFAFKIRPAFDWLRQDLSKARQEGKAIILNFHDPYNYWTDSDKAQFDQILTDYSVSAAFVAHHHAFVGASVAADKHQLTADESYKPVLTSSGRDQFYGSSRVPWFYSGSVIYNTYLLVNFTGSNTMTVERVFSTGGDVDRIDKSAPVVVPLKTPKANVSYTLPPADTNTVKLWNQSGFAARMTVKYSHLGNMVEKDSGVVLTGGVAIVDVPISAAGIVVRGFAYTAYDILAFLDGKTPGTRPGLRPEAWKSIAVQSAAPNSCFKTFGTIFSPQWAADCN